MKTVSRLLGAVVSSLAVSVATAGAALAQTPVDPRVTPVENRSPLGPLFGPVSFAVLFMLGAGALVILIVLLYMRYAPRFARDEGSAKVVHADRVLPGREVPRRAVDLSQAVPIVVQPPAVPALAAASAASAPAAPAAAAPAAPGAAAPAPTAPPAMQAAAPAPAPGEAPTDAPAPSPAAPEAPAVAAPAAAAAPAEHVEVTMDQEAYEAALAELLAAGTDGRIAEGKARRAGMIAAKKKAAGGG
jgi:hypothetical protein